MAVRNIMLFAWGGGSYAELAPSVYFPGDGSSDQDQSIYYFGRREAFVNLSSIEDGAQAFWTAAAQLTDLWGGERQVAITYEPTGDGDIPWEHYRPGDYVWATDETGAALEQVRVLGISGKRNPQTRRMEYTPMLESRFEGHDVRSARYVKRLGNGFMGGRSSSATISSPDILSSGTRSGIAGPQVNTGDTMEVGRESSPWTPDTLCKLANYEITSKATGSGTSTFGLYVNGGLVTTFSMGAGAVEARGCVIGSGIYFAPGDGGSRVTMKVEAAGHAGASCKLGVVPVNS